MESICKLEYTKSGFTFIVDITYEYEQIYFSFKMKEVGNPTIVATLSASEFYNHFDKI